MPYTKGPWTWENGEYDDGCFATDNGCPGHDDGIPTYLEPVGIALMEGGADDIEQWIIDAQFIAAAPDVFEAGELLDKIIQDMLNGVSTEGMVHAARHAWKLAKAKALGETQQEDRDGQ